MANFVYRIFYPPPRPRNTHTLARECFREKMASNWILKG